jgi:hypothetical protein
MADCPDCRGTELCSQHFASGVAFLAVALGTPSQAEKTIESVLNRDRGEG